MKNFDFNGKHLMLDAIVKKPKILADASLGSSILESIVESKETNNQNLINVEKIEQILNKMRLLLKNKNK